MSIKELLKQSQQFSPITKIQYDSDDGFAAAMTRWSHAVHPKIAASVAVGTVEDVQTAIKLCATHKVPFLATSSMHNMDERHNDVHDAVQIDISHLRDLSINSKDSTMTLGPGIMFGDILEPLYAAGKEMSTGICSTVSVIGATLGGGVGRYVAYHGLIIDHLLSADIILAPSGERVTTSRTQHSGLFWALRGAGSYLGIVVSATYRIHDQTNNGTIQATDLAYPFSANKPLHHLLQSYEGKLPKDLMITTAVVWNPAPEVQAPVIMLNIVSPTSKERHDELLAPFLSLDPAPVMRDTKTLPWHRMLADTAFGVDALYSKRGHHGAARPLCVGAVNKNDSLVEICEGLRELYEREPGARTSAFNLEYYSGDVVREIGRRDREDGGGVFAQREAEAYMLIISSWDPSIPTSRTEAIKWATEAREICAKSSGFKPDGSYGPTSREGDAKRTFLTYACGDETAEQVYGLQNLERLREVKKRWDPEGWFDFGKPRLW